MNRQEKAQLVERLKDDFVNYEAVFLLNYQGLTVNKAQVLRRLIRANGGVLRVAKLRLVERAINDTKYGGDFSSHFKGQVGFIFANGEGCAVARVLSSFVKEEELGAIVGGRIGDSVVDKDFISHLASLPSREVMFSRVCSTIQLPAVQLIGLCNVLLCRLVWVLASACKKKSGQ